MTRYDFTTQPNRLDQNTMKWHEAESNPELLELWVADMDFLPVPEIRDAVINYAETHIFGFLIQVKSFISPSLIGKKINTVTPLIKRVLFSLKVLFQPFQQPFKPLPKKVMLFSSTHQFIHRLLVQSV